MPPLRVVSKAGGQTTGRYTSALSPILHHVYGGDPPSHGEVRCRVGPLSFCPFGALLQRGGKDKDSTRHQS